MLSSLELQLRRLRYQVASLRPAWATEWPYLKKTRTQITTRLTICKSNKTRVVAGTHSLGPVLLRVKLFAPARVTHQRFGADDRLPTMEALHGLEEIIMANSPTVPGTEAAFGEHQLLETHYWDYGSADKRACCTIMKKTQVLIPSRKPGIELCMLVIPELPEGGDEGAETGRLQRGLGLPV